MNLENFERVKAAILANPESFDMSRWGGTDRHSPCGTAACIAGFCDWLMALDGAKRTMFSASGRVLNPYKNPFLDAIEFLGINRAMAYELFYVGQWPSQIRQRYLGARTSKRRAAIAVARIDHFIRTVE